MHHDKDTSGSKMIREVDFLGEAPGKRKAVFLALTAWARIYGHFDDASVTSREREYLFPLVLMMHRFDGGIGFVGGFVEGKEDFRERVVAEVMEEVNIRIDPAMIQPLVAHEDEKTMVRLYHLPLGEVTVERLRDIIRASADAEDTIAEGNPFWAHLGDYGRGGKGWHRLRGANTLALAVGEELDAVRELLYAAPPAGALPKVATR